MGEIEKLFFQSDLNLGNFSTCLNNKSNRPDMTFEFPIKFPIKFGLGATQDEFVIRFVYKKSDNALQNGVLKEIVILHIDTNTEILHYDGTNNGDLKINFSFFKNKLDEEWEKTNEVHAISMQIIELFEKHSGPELNQKLPKEIKLQIKELEKRQKAIYPDYELHLIPTQYGEGEGYYLDEREKGINLDFLKKYSPNLPLFNFPFPFTEEYLKNIQEKSNINDEDFESLLSISQDSLAQLSSNNTDVNKYIERSLLECLSNYTHDNGYYNAFLNEGLADILYDFLIRFDGRTCTFIAKDLIAKVPLIKKVMDYFEFHNSMSFGVDQLFDSENGIVVIKNLREMKPQIEVNGIFDTDNFKYIKDCIYDSLGYHLDLIGRSYKNTFFIPAVRTKMERFFRIGDGDSYLQEVLYLLHQTKLYKEAQNFIDRYLQKFEIADGIELNLSEDSSGTKIYLIKEGKRQELADVGYGVAQVLPIILKLGYLISRKSPEKWFEPDSDWDDSTIIIEEPETNLHPALQSKLADMFVECYEKYRIHFIIETHSEYLIRKLQYLTAKKEFAAKDSVIYYFNDPNKIPEGEKQVKKIEILEDGSLSDDFGSGFFDEATNLKFELMELRKAQKN